ncbi:RNB domain-containing ribonuclease [Nocardia cyriacigeorgica]|uniref:RNB domain-containing ribonuclease n=1 Tax=Nocardia cyriacigeorgica TaxID=135487 RepID=UPI0013B848D2|nr:RNB domain-containing ribonuclease [Nocardia cyriacigeorgica]NEW51526.1 RNB domain-containing ribonuclease [Nocardia cyriacigeorgica]
MELHQRIVSAPVDFGAIRSEFGLTSAYPAEATAEARDAVDAFAGARVDRTDIPFVTIDPPGALDLDQALHLERTDTGFLLHYAIADLGAVVVPDGALAAEAGTRGQTFYLPDATVPLHPPVLSENSASLLPEQTRPAALWTIELDHDAEPVRYSVERAVVRSRARLDYAGVQADADAGRLPAAIAALPEFGTRRIAAGLARGAIELRLPAQSVIRDEGADGHWRLVLEPRTDVDDWNEQVSLLAGMCAARIMLDGGAEGSGERIGLLRTMPPPPDSAIASIRRTAAALGVTWPADQPVGRMLAGLDPSTPATLVLMSEATGLLRGAAYTVLDGTDPASNNLRHSAIGAPYAHVTAPLRRLVDRFTTEICLAHCAGTPVPEWVRDDLSATAETMKRSDGVANKIERACIDLTEATLLSQRIGTEFDAVVVREGNGNRPAEIFIAAPPLLGPCEGSPPEGATVRVRLESADPVTRKVVFTYLSESE